MKLLRGKYRSRKAMKKALGLGKVGTGRYYSGPVTADQFGNRYVTVGRFAPRRYLISAGALR